jgi:hypothetical protein
VTARATGGEPAFAPDTRRTWTAEIEWRKTDDGARFVVVARPAGAGRAVTIAGSPSLGWPPTDAESVQALVDAVGDLEAALARAEWAPAAPGRAWYAKRFAWEPAALPQAASPSPPPAEPGLFAPQPAWPASTVDRWRCEIAWDAGWAESRFRALAYPPRARRGRELKTSRPLKWLLMAQPDAASDEHRHELEDLAGALAADGWERVGRAASWYAERFCWPGEGAPAAPPTSRSSPAGLGP